MVEKYGRKVFISAYRLSSVLEGSQGRNLEEGTESETMAICHGLLTIYTPRVKFSCLSYTGQAHLPRNDTAHSGLGPSMSLTGQDKSL